MFGTEALFETHPNGRGRFDAVTTLKALDAFEEHRLQLVLIRLPHLLISPNDIADVLAYG